MLPSLPAVSKEVFELYEAETEDIKDFMQIHQFFVITWRCGIIHGRRLCRDELREKYSA
ncbi:MAG: hypothetical protein QXO22_01680 [Thermosphaera sp.]